MNIKVLLKEYIDKNLEQIVFRKMAATDTLSLKEGSISDYVKNNQDDKAFQKLLFEYIDKKNLKDSDVYNKVNIDRRLFSKIRSDKKYHPSKNTVILLALSLELGEKEALKLLESASYYLPKNNIFDLIIRFCFINKIYNINDVNNLLYEYDCLLLN